MSDDEDSTSPDLGTEEHTKPGIGTGDGTGEAFIAWFDAADRALAALKTLAGSCPPPGASSRDRHLGVLELGVGDLGMLCFDVRRVTAELRRKERERS